MKPIKDESIVIQLAAVHSMLPKVKELIDEQINRIKMLEEETAALRKQLISACNELMEIKR
jgi:ribosomal protein L13